jgi:putative methanogenesis marker protein 8
MRPAAVWEILYLCTIEKVRNEMQSAPKNILNQIKKEKGQLSDLHITRFYSSYIAISNGTVIYVSNPHMAYCPLASSLYKPLKPSKNSSSLKQAIAESVNSKISRFGHFTPERELFRKDIAIPYGASEILMYAMRGKSIDAAVIVCDGAGTVIVKKPGLIQGIGARMNSIFYTSPIQEVITRLEREGSCVIFRNGGIDQAEGVKRAAGIGYKNIAVTVNASMDESFGELRKIEKKCRISLKILAICTTGIDDGRIREIGRYADIVWSCASEGTKKMIGKKAILQLSRRIPVFVLSKKGLDLVAKYSSKKELVKSLDPKKQYIIARDTKGRKVKMGDFDARLNEARLPVRHRKEAVLNAI